MKRATDGTFHFFFPDNGAGKFRLLVTCTALLVSALLSGCQFFGKQVDTAAKTGQIAGGTSIVGSWSLSVSSYSATGQPTVAFTRTFSFDPNGTARIEDRGALSTDITCTAFGKYTTSDTDVIIYLQAAQPSTCRFYAQYHFTNVQITGSGQVLKMTDLNNNVTANYYVDRSQKDAPAGVWDFDGAPLFETSSSTVTIDYLFLDYRGYFVAQVTLTDKTTKEASQGFLNGFFTLDSTGFVLNIFDYEKEPQVAFTISYAKLMTEPGLLHLITIDSSGQQFVDTGKKL